MLILFSLTLFMSAFLLFSVQLMVAKMILPLLGGSPAVWNTCQFFFQGALLCGYAYAHLSTRYLGTRRQAIAHSLLLFLPLVSLPIALSKTGLILENTNPIPWLLGLLISSVALPFFVVSTSAPLIQKWFAETDHPSSKEPYFLYSASNFGSLLGLISYPILIEPYLSLSEQSTLWAVAYVILILFTLGCAICLWRFSPQIKPTNYPFSVSKQPVISDKNLTWQQQAQWTLLSFIPSSLLLGVTTYLTTDLAAIPLLWAIPLILYLLSFILTFARNPRLPHQILMTLVPLFSSTLIILFLAKVMRPVALLVPLHLVGFFAIACVFHGELSRRRPSVAHLTEFYLWISLGGVFGGLFNAIAAPILFPSVLEYPLILLLALLTLNNPIEAIPPQKGPPLLQAPQGDLDTWFSQLRKDQQSRKAQKLGIQFNLKTTQIISLSLLFGALLVGFTARNISQGWFGNLFAIALLIALYITFSLPRPSLAIGLTLILLLGQFSLGNMSGVLQTERNFFGVNRIVYDRRGPYHSLVHGTTLHGRQSLDPQRSQEPLTYFHPTGPIGQTFQQLNTSDRLQNIAVLGLGIGTLAAYAQPDQTWTFYEIDPIVEKIARDTRYFTFLEQAKAPFSVILGDARLRLAQTPNNTYDLLVMDAFSSDSIPVHLVTQEALKLYLTKLRERGIIAINISNRYINLEPVLGTLAQTLGLATLQQLDRDLSPEEKALGKTPSQWVLLARKADDFGPLRADARWQPISETQKAPLWTDDFSDLLGVLRLFDLQR
ncbi:spermidine synthase [Laspinema olomoucense]|uniref:spermidine synthase n=1 Tax=Laspinema olomoucense TaxID=3231600 RepID=UPI0021BA54A7|nr:fused MFS/spermidine synthase [Laspinema sp. D3c]MCT7993994.1 fused MFS/spermidine synthase [Laspinema sp. D3c]